MVSIASAIYADWSNEVKDNWTAKLQAAYDTLDWDAVKAVLQEMRGYFFSE